MAFSVEETGIPLLGLDYAATEALVAQAFAVWPNTSCDGSFPSIAITSMGPLSCRALEHNSSGPNSNAVLFRQDSWSHDPAAIGLTTVSFNPTTGKILGADLEVNLTSFALTPQDLSYVVAHEAGHFLGLDHSADSGALMFYAYSPFSSTVATPSLQLDDAASICAAYPISRPATACDFEPERGFSPLCGGDVEGSCSISAARPAAPAVAWRSAALVALGLGVALCWRRARRGAARAFSA